jgi:methylenetetrahydrofolate reductase (NADPH)
MKISQLIAGSDRPFVSLEFFPPKDLFPAAPDGARPTPAELSFYQTVAQLMPLNPLFVSITYGAGGGNREGSLELATEIRRRFSVEVMGHLTCIGATREVLSAHIERLRQGGVDNILALRGDPQPDGSDEQAADGTQTPGRASPSGSGEFVHASDLVRFVKQTFPGTGIAVAGYPAPHPESPTFASDWRYTVAKIREGADFVVTQLFFDVREYVAFVDRLNDMGVNVPVIPGVLPIQSFASLRRTLALCGANIPGRLYLEMEAANEKGGVAAVREAGIDFAVRQIRSLLDNGAPGIHLYTLNQAETCLQIVRHPDLSIHPGA